ncbi:hypothetical protein DAEQUDRAFT_732704 [Daedalea quercina L-15889]|uniref:Uncharacterized protein n=1 Tax=Daedalea quercina L-15889 TaxID=1314783 RepID=A0A165LGR9_9APHY|nr:hypothetical protein DAEQUDRAFT_732704 [Daedalea quercina L-15889]
MIALGCASYLSSAVVLAFSQLAVAQGNNDNTGWGTSSSARTIAGAIIGVLLGFLVLGFAFVIVRRHKRIYGTPLMPSIELRRVSSYVSVFTRRQNAELGANDQGPGYAAPPYAAQPPPYNGPEAQTMAQDSKHEIHIDSLEVPVAPGADERMGGLGYDATQLPAKKGLHGGSVDVVDADGRYEYDISPPSPSTGSSSSTPPPPPTPSEFDEPAAHDAWYKGYP